MSERVVQRLLLIDSQSRANDFTSHSLVLLVHQSVHWSSIAFRQYLSPNEIYFEALPLPKNTQLKLLRLGARYSITWVEM